MLKISDSLSLPLEAVTEKIAFLGGTGSGKTYAATKLAELMLEAGAQIVVLDCVGVWYGLRVGVKSQVYIFGGMHGDVPLEASSGPMIADLIVDRGISAVLDISQFETDADLHRFAVGFGKRFFFRKKGQKSAVHLFVEECQELFPQNPMGGELNVLHAYNRIWKIGRNYGIGGSLISQRPQEVNKKALNLAGTLFMFRTTGPQERKTIEGWVKDKDIEEDVQALLPKLETGAPKVWSPSFLGVSKTVRILKKKSADISATPKVGDRSVEKPLTPIDLEKLNKEMRATIERTKADDPKELRKTIADLENQLRHRPISKDSQKTFDAWKEQNAELRREVSRLRKDLSAVYRDHSEWLEKSARKAAFLIIDFDSARAGVKQAADRFNVGANDVPFPITDYVKETPAAKVGSHGFDVTQLEKHIAANGRKPEKAHSDNDLGKCEKKILSVLVNYPNGCVASKLTLLAGYRWSGGFRNSLSKLRSLGLLEGENKGVMTLTHEGFSIAERAPLPTGRDLAKYWLEHPSFGLCERKILAALLDYPQGLDADGMLKETGYEWSGGFRNSLSRLRTAGVMIGDNGEVMKAHEDLL